MAEVPLSYSLHGFREAVRRYDKYRASRFTYASLFEALNWSVAIDDRAKRDLAPSASRTDWYSQSDESRTLLGVRFARNRFRHQWADALGTRRAELQSL